MGPTCPLPKALAACHSRPSIMSWERRSYLIAALCFVTRLAKMYRYMDA